MVFNPDQTDADADDFGNACDADKDNDCIVDSFDYETFIVAFGTADAECDFRADGVVGMPDLAELLALFGDPPGPSGFVLNCVPDGL